MALPKVDNEYLLNFLAGLLNTPSPTGLAQPAIDYTERALAVFPGMRLTLSR